VDAADRRAPDPSLASTLVLSELPPDAAPAQAALDAYVAELDRRFDDHFVPGPVSDEDVAAFTRPRGAFVVGSHDGSPVACGGVRRLDPGTVEVKRMWVHADWRGAGLGARLLRHLESLATDLGCRRIVLDTNRVLGEAVALYARAGYREIERYNDNPYAQAWFEKRVDPDPR
jgi:GNAT superfamily N-acetyltransferase